MTWDVHIVEREGEVRCQRQQQSYDIADVDRLSLSFLHAYMLKIDE